MEHDLSKDCTKLNKIYDFVIIQYCIENIKEFNIVSIYI